MLVNSIINTHSNLYKTKVIYTITKNKFVFNSFTSKKTVKNTFLFFHFIQT